MFPAARSQRPPPQTPLLPSAEPAADSADSADSAATLSALVSAAGGQSVLEAASAALLARYPRAARVADLLPDRPLDSRVVEVSVSLLSTGAELDGAALRAPLSPPLRVSLPFRDLSAVRWVNGSAAGLSVGAEAFAQARVAVVCPRTARATTAEATWRVGGTGE